MDTKLLWSNVLEELKLTVSPAIFQTMFQGTCLVSIDNNVAKIGCPSSYIQSLIESRYYSLIKDIIAGFYLLLEPHFKIGRTIEVNKCKGEIKKITLKNTYLQTKNEDLYIIPNGEIKTVLVKK